MILKYETSRLRALEVSNSLSQSDLSTLLINALDLLKPKVVENLPPYFQNINSVIDAEIWFKQIVSESRLFVIEHRNTGSTIGFLFAHTGEYQEAHIGYLLGEKHWGKGLASEMLGGFIELAIGEREWIKLVAGVDKSNDASSRLLAKLGFVEQPSNDYQAVFYEYQLSKPQS